MIHLSMPCCTSWEFERTTKRFISCLECRICGCWSTVCVFFNQEFRTNTGMSERQTIKMSFIYQKRMSPPQLNYQNYLEQWHLAARRRSRRGLGTTRDCVYQLHRFCYTRRISIQISARSNGARNSRLLGVLETAWDLSLVMSVYNTTRSFT